MNHPYIKQKMFLLGRTRRPFWKKRAQLVECIAGKTKKNKTQRGPKKENRFKAGGGGARVGGEPLKLEATEEKKQRKESRRGQSVQEQRPGKRSNISTRRKEKGEGFHEHLRGKKGRRVKAGKKRKRRGFPNGGYQKSKKRGEGVGKEHAVFWNSWEENTTPEKNPNTRNEKKRARAFSNPSNKGKKKGEPYLLRETGKGAPKKGKPKSHPLKGKLSVTLEERRLGIYPWGGELKRGSEKEKEGTPPRGEEIFPGRGKGR